MIRIALMISKNPSEAEVFVRFVKDKDIIYRLPAIIDTGAQISLFPLELLELLSPTAFNQEEVIIEQAGIAGQEFKAIRTHVHLSFEDFDGNITYPMLVEAWFANTERWIIGMADIIERGVLHLDIPNLSGYIDLP